MAQATINYSDNWRDRLDALGVSSGDELLPYSNPRIVHGDELQFRATLLIGRALLHLLNDLESVHDIRYREPSDIADIEYIMLRFFPEYNDIDIAIAEQKLANDMKVIEGLAEMAKMDGIE